MSDTKNTPNDDSSTSGGATASSPAKPLPRPRSRRVRLLRTAGLLVLMLGVLACIAIPSAEYYTARPDFCASCHIMEPYYASWTNDIHGHKLGVRCVDCHYAPGEQHTIMAKFKGLSQATSYFSGRAGASRPKARVNDASCLTSRCHGDGNYMTKVLSIGEMRIEKRLVGGQQTEIRRMPTVQFVHADHLQVDERLTDVLRKLDELAKRIPASVSPEAAKLLRRAAKAVGPAAEREAAMGALLERLGLAARTSEAIEWLRLEHTRTRLQQLSNLNCAACHSYDESGRRHVGLDTQTCFTCHFANQSFNTETGECLRCHEPPTRDVPVHDTATTQTAAVAMMDHREIVSRGIDCAACHLDVVRGDARVRAQDCRDCHDQARYLRDFEDRTTDVVAEYHRIHVAAQRAACRDCHQEVVHRLIDPEQVASSAAFLRPVLDDCKHCHAGHHSQQVDLLMGVGGRGIDQPMPNAMFGSRVNCRACHTQAGSDFKGEPLREATKSACVACHGTDYEQLFDQWVSEISTYLEEADGALARVDQTISERRQANLAIPAEALELVSAARHNLKLIRGGNGIHNKNFALQLLEISKRDLDRAAALLAEENQP